MSQKYDYNFDFFKEKWSKVGPNLNSFFESIQSLNAGNMSPENQLDGMPWLDTSGDKPVFKIYSASSSSWELANENNRYIEDLKLATGSKNKLWERLEVAINPDGTLKSDLAENMTEWIDSTLTATYISADTFTVPGDYTNTFVPFRRLKITLDSKHNYSAVKTVNYGETSDQTTITLVEPVIDATIQKVEYSLVKTGEDGSFPIEFLTNELVDIGLPVGAVNNFFASGASSTGDQVELTWKNPPDLRVKDENGNLALLSELGGVKIVRKNSSYPTSPEDGNVVYDGLEESYIDNDVIEGQTYHYSAFTYSKRQVFSEARKDLAETKIRTLDYNETIQDFRALQKTGKNVLKWSNPSDFEFEGVIIRRSKTRFLDDIDEGELVYDGAGEQYNDTDIEQGVPYYYTAWAYSINSKYSSPENVTEFYDYGLIAPGPKEVIDDAYGGKVRFYGEVDPEAFGQIAGMPFNGSKLADYFGLTAGGEMSRDFLNCKYLKFVYILTENDSNYNVFERKQRILYVPKKPYRYNLSHNHIYNAGIVYGGYYPNFQYDTSHNKRTTPQKETVKTDSHEFIVRLIRDHLENDVNRTTGLTGGSNDGSGNGNYDIHPDAEYTRLMLSVFEGAIDPKGYNWYHPNNIPESMEALEHNLGTGNNGMYNNEDLHLHNSFGNGSNAWEMEVPQSNVGRRLNRGYYGASRLSGNTSGLTDANLAWRPLLDYVLPTE